jgi:glycosyltransferase involved in cell wall biosynthesis
MINYSIVIPVYNSQNILPELIGRLLQLSPQIDNSFEIILIDNCSSDNSWSVMKEFHKKDSRVKIIHLQKNFGQHNTILYGLNHATGEYIITMDDDLQHPPEEIPKLINKIQDGYSVINGKYTIKHHSRLDKFFTSKIELLFKDYSEYSKYPQLWGEFDHNVSIIELIFNCGKKSPHYIWR